MASFQQLMLGQQTGATPLLFDEITLATNGTTGNQLTAANLNAGIIGATPSTWTYPVVAAVPHTTIFATGTITLLNPLICNGSTISTITRGWQFNKAGVGETDYEKFKATLAASHDDMTLYMILLFEVDPTGAAGDQAIDFGIIESTASYAVSQQHISNPSQFSSQGRILAHANSGTSSSTLSPAPPGPTASTAVYVEVVLMHDKTNGMARVAACKQSDRTFYGYVEKADTLGTTIDYLLYDYNTFKGGKLTQCVFAADWTLHEWPKIPITPPTPTVTCLQTATDQNTIYWDVSVPNARYNIEVSDNGGAYSAIATNILKEAIASNAYDHAVTNGHTYQYKVTAVCGTRTATSSPSTIMTVDNSKFITVNTAVFDGTNDYGQTAATLTGIADSQVFTMSFWYKPTTGGDATAQNIIQTSIAARRFQIVRTATTNLLNIFGRNAAGGTILNINSTVALTANAWHHVAVTYDGTSLKLYADGILDGTNNTALSSLNVNSESVTTPVATFVAISIMLTNPTLLTT